MASIFAHRGRYRAQAIDKTGKRHTKDFDRHAQANAWAAAIEVESASEHAPELGGPTQATLAQTLRHYGCKYSAAKGGAVQELGRINVYAQPPAWSASD